MPQYKDELPVKVSSGPRATPDDLSLPSIPAMQVTSDLRFLEQIGGPPFEGAAVAAMLSLDAIRPHTSIVAAWSTTNERAPSLKIFDSGGRVTSRDLIRLNGEDR